MTIRSGTYTIYKGVEMAINQYYGHGLNQEFEDNNRVISYSSEHDKLDGFDYDAQTNRFKKNIELKDLQNAFLVITKAIYKGDEFEIEPYNGDDIQLHIATKKLKLGKRNNFYELHDSFGNPYYLGEVKISEVEKLWEERQISNYAVPIPEGIELVKFIELK